MAVTVLDRRGIGNASEARQSEILRVLGSVLQIHFTPGFACGMLMGVMHNPIIAALDVPNLDRAVGLAQKLRGAVASVKIGSELFTSVGPEVVRQLRGSGLGVFLDLKFHDIPNTVKSAVAAATRLNVQMLTVHCSGGTEMLRAAESSAQETARTLGVEPPLVLGVTVLTSMDQQALAGIGVSSSVDAHVERLAKLAIDAGLRGLVCSPLELAALRKILPSTVKLVTPGIRGAGDQSGDQKRTLNARDAIAAGADWLVIGRPVCAAEDPRVAAEQILASLHV